MSQARHKRDTIKQKLDLAVRKEKELKERLEDLEILRVQENCNYQRQGLFLDTWLGTHTSTISTRRHGYSWRMS